MSWAEVAKSSNSRKGDINNLRLISGNTYVVRFVGDPEPFYKYFVAGKSAICANPDKCPVKAKYNIDPTLRYAVNVIDRADGKLKVLEVPPSVLKPVIAWWKARKHDPGGDNGCDFNIEITGQKKNTRYTVMPLDISPFTEAEKKMIEEGTYDLKKLYKAVPDAEIEARLFGTGATGAAAPSAAALAAASASAGFGETPPF